MKQKDINAYLSQKNILILTEEQSQTCEGPITVSELLHALKSMPNIKSPRNDDVTKEFHKTAFTKGRFISEGGRLIYDILEISDNFKIKGFLMALDIEKTFFSVNNLLLITAQEKYGFKEDCIK